MGKLRDIKIIKLRRMCPICKKRRWMDVFGYWDEKTKFGTQAICTQGHFLKGITKHKGLVGNITTLLNQVNNKEKK